MWCQYDIRSDFHLKSQSLPLRMSLSSSTSSCIKLAVWIISIISAKRLCSMVSSLGKAVLNEACVCSKWYRTEHFEKGFWIILTLNQLVLLLLLTLGTPKLVSFSYHQHQISALLQTSELGFLHQQSTVEFFVRCNTKNRYSNDCRHG